MIIKREDLYETLRKYCPGKYSVGLHGITLKPEKDFYHLDIADKEKVSESVAAKIVQDGLRVKSGRTINGTVAFCGRLDDRQSLKRTFDGLSHYWYGSANDYIIVAPPVELKSEDGDTLYVGATNLESKYKSHFDKTGNQTTTILDKVILANESKIDPKFILGRFKKLDDGTIDLQINPQHLSQTGGKVTNEEFDGFVNNLHGDLFIKYPGLIATIIKKDYKALRTFLQETYCDSRRDAYLLETISQMIDEDSIENLRSEDLETIQKLKAEYLAQKRDEEEKKQKLSAMAKYSFEEIQDFALKHDPTSFQDFQDFQDFPDSIKNNVELMRRLTKTPNLNSFIVYYLGKDVRNDSEAMINLINNCLTSNFDEYLRYDWNYSDPQPNKSDLGYETIGLDVRSNPLFWESLNTRILEINKKEGTKYPYFDTEKEIRIATELKQKNTQK